MRFAARILGVVILFPLSAGSAADQDEGYLGVQVRKSLDLPGIIVVETVADGPAAKAGLKAEDVITKIDGKEINDLVAFVQAIRKAKPGDMLTLTVERSGRDMTVKVTVGKWPSDGS